MAVRLLPGPRVAQDPFPLAVNYMFDANGQAWQTVTSNTKLITLSCQWPQGRVVSLTKLQQVASRLSPEAQEGGKHAAASTKHQVPASMIKNTWLMQFNQKSQTK